MAKVNNAIHPKVTFLAIISPLSGHMNLPALSAISVDLHMSLSLTNLTITVYTLVSGLTPSLIAPFSDSYGQRPVYLFSLALCALSNIGLALQSSFPASISLLCVQAAGAGVTISLGSAVVADMITRAERGKYIGYAALWLTLSPALAPTGRNVVGDGSVRPERRWSRTGWDLLKHIKRHEMTEEEEGRHTMEEAAEKKVSIHTSVRILGEKEAFVTVMAGVLFSGGYFMVLITLGSQLSERFSFRPIIVGVCYLPLETGMIASRWTVGWLLDWNFGRWARNLGLKFDLDRQQRLEEVPIDKIRLEVALGALYVLFGTVVAYGWTVKTKSSLVGIEIALFFLGVFFAGAINGLNVLVINTHPDSPATAVAASKLVRCVVAAGASAVAMPIIERAGMGWASASIAGAWLGFSPLLWMVMYCGANWRQDVKLRSNETGRDRA
ncbi:uncharacterized protein PODANS_6_6340 [Podospora anserina S mat+]|uniref:Podospora anserina S mat+ genomic DNA chromosome 6, supercontig 2 n=1 Tax=Podospora anserina (strain S / ATCC MYA-4624 / DSM 980 / FGSC 10383) TaxID=515849 RepID=B2B3I9_PODAN|nr:uncharacterized protein PODANS_6_6340 [Podospora anserina S mat+]CAP71675.1 unnamed protein product [Podospora anserina S mat+]CDP31067.1 Putative Protein similar to transporter YIL121W of Saccharomyces cerevisiae [Podospora anserina S mat+]